MINPKLNKKYLLFSFYLMIISWSQAFGISRKDAGKPCPSINVTVSGSNIHSVSHEFVDIDGDNHLRINFVGVIEPPSYQLQEGHESLTGKKIYIARFYQGGTLSNKDYRNWLKEITRAEVNLTALVIENLSSREGFAQSLRISPTLQEVLLYNHHLSIKELDLLRGLSQIQTIIAVDSERNLYRWHSRSNRFESRFLPEEEISSIQSVSDLTEGEYSLSHSHVLQLSGRRIQDALLPWILRSDLNYNNLYLKNTSVSDRLYEVLEQNSHISTLILEGHRISLGGLDRLRSIPHLNVIQARDWANVAYIWSRVPAPDHIIRNLFNQFGHAIN